MQMHTQIRRPLEIVSHKDINVIENKEPTDASTNKFNQDIVARSRTIVKDGQYECKNIFDASLDAPYAALERVGAPNLEIVISENGWSSEGGVGAIVDNANTYYGNLIKHIKNRDTRKA
ncbi:unnamed protein product [Lupinus luteus]|uniref:glucan endo-1,3-beta-D-glucosidase n=1 Tax=Lupinus luteus TaxID=3873 RepID=A0AAV1WPC6_LUPLU